ncbi:MAG: hypothetical protein R3B69_00660 [Candidatus Paceibacterota bacterium]
MKHEKALLVLTAYVIGFITAYIAFGLTITGPKEAVYVTTTHSKEIKQHEGATTDGVGVVETSEGLFALLGAQERVLSAQAISFGAGAGYHYDVFVAMASPDGKYIYYCAQEDRTSDSCVGYLYDVLEDKTRQVHNENNDPVLLQSTAKKVSWQDGQLYLPMYRSYDIMRPWKVIPY